jgi:hypothetical protein
VVLPAPLATASLPGPEDRRHRLPTTWKGTPIVRPVVGWLPTSLQPVDLRRGGYRTFLGADPVSAYRLRLACDEQVAFTESFVVPPALLNFGARLGRALGIPPEPEDADTAAGTAAAVPTGPAVTLDIAVELRASLVFQTHRFHPQMLDWVAEQIAGLVLEDGVSPGEIVVLAPYLNDALRFSLSERLVRLGIPARSHRPSRALREEPAAQCLLTLTALAYPDWGLPPARFDVANALIQAIEGMDLVRAQLLAEIVYRVRDGLPILSSFDIIQPQMQERITYLLEGLRSTARLADETSQERRTNWTNFSRLFGEILSQPGYGYRISRQPGGC